MSKKLESPGIPRATAGGNEPVLQGVIPGTAFSDSGSAVGWLPTFQIATRIGISSPQFLGKCSCGISRRRIR